MGIREYIYEQVAERRLGVAEAKTYLLELGGETDSDSGAIAIVGIACRLPEADDVDRYWENLVEERISIRDLPTARHQNATDYIRAFHADDLVRERRIRPDGSLRLDFARRGYVDRIEFFDAEFFAINPREARAMDPNQRVLLETAYHALQDGGFAPDALGGRAVGVFVGIDHVEEHKYKKLAADDPLVVTGTWPGVLASRLSYLWDLRGPALVTDTACSSGLVSVHQACRSLRVGECELAIVGGLSSFSYEAMTFESELAQLESIEARDDAIRTFDRSAAGTTWGEGVGVVVLKPLAAAVRDRDRIHAVIKGSAINNDGASNGITAPNAEAQEQLLLDAWRDADIDPATVGYIEAHGTGTVLGDPIEISSLTKAFRHHTDARQFCGVGSVKPSIGHLVGGSGIASLLKVIQMLRHRCYAASLNFVEPNPFIDFVESPLFVCDRATPWESRSTGPRRAGINSFGFSGTNCHVVLEEAPAVAPDVPIGESGASIFTVSARSRGQLSELVAASATMLAANRPELAAACHTANVGRQHHAWRLAVVARDIDELIARLRAIAAAPEDASLPGVQRGHFRPISRQKPDPGPDELTESQRRRLTERAEATARHYRGARGAAAADALCELYVRGADVAWGKLHGDDALRTVELPRYPFAKVAHWYRREQSTHARAAAPPRLGAVLTARGVSTPEGDHYIAELSATADWILTDHIILGRQIVPGTAFIELALEIAREYGEGPVTLADIIYDRPCVVAFEETRQIVATVQRAGSELSMAFASQSAGSWISHAECTVRHSAAAPDRATIDLAALRRELEGEDSRDALFDLAPRETAIALGPRWANERIVAAGKDSALVELELPAEFRGDLDGAVFHVALFDNAVNAISQKSATDLYLPFHYRELTCLAPMPPRIFSHIRMNRDAWSVNRETITYDIDLYDEHGELFAVVRDYITKRVGERSARLIERAGANALTFGWRAAAQTTDRAASAAGSVVLICAEPLAELADALRNAGADVAQTTAAELPAVLDTEGVPPDRIVYAAGWKPGASAPTAVPEALIEELFEIARTLDRLHDRKLALTVLGTGAAAVGPADRVAPECSALAALTNAIALEFDNLEARYIDADGSVAGTTLARQILCATGQHDLYLRADAAWVRTVEQTTLPAPEPIATDGGTYLITGGTGALGLELAVRLAEQAPVTIGLVARGDWDSDDTDPERRGYIAERLAAIRAHGSEVVEFRADVCDRAAMTTVVNELSARNAAGQITGIFHCAGVAGDGIILTKSPQRLRDVIAPKVRGAIVLDEITRAKPPELMVFYSSVLAVFGDIGQCDYMAANAYLDGFAEWRESQGRRTRSINWPAWRDVGMAVRYGVADGENTIAALATDSALDALESIVAGQEIRVLPGVADSERIATHRGLHAIWTGTERITATAQAPAIPAFEDSDEYTDTERRLLAIWAQTLQVARIDIYDQFGDLGGQSFLAIQLYRAINREFEHPIEVSDIYSFPSVHQLAAEIDRRRPRGPDDPLAQPANQVEALVAQLKSGKTSVADALDLLKTN